MSDNEPRIIFENVSHPSAGGGDAISSSATVVSKLDALAQSVERLVHTTVCQPIPTLTKVFYSRMGKYLILRARSVERAGP